MALLIDISKVKTTPFSKMDISNLKERIVLGEKDAENEFADVLLSGSIKNEDSFLRLNGSLNADITRFCSRCLKEVVQKYETSISLILKHKDLKNEISNDSLEDEILFFEGNIINLDSFVLGILRADMPMAVLCGDDCKGLCSVCGIDLNENCCNCEVERIPSPFDELKLYFNETKTKEV